MASETYLVGEEITGTVRNTSTGVIYLNTCFLQLEHQVRHRWVVLPNPKGGRVCTTQLNSLGPGSESTISFRIPEGTSPGRVRLALVGVWDASDRPLTSNDTASHSFSLAAPPPP
ncbi:MAG: hypothetical protein HOP28_12130 [Gemmatimonadales bacterium]|nr:hypothetical protein [Gemmatimonadales bacterium]